MKRLMVGLALCAALAADAKTKVMLFFDTEDYTCDRSNDAIRDIANLLTSEGVRGNFNIAGFLATRIVELRRTDVIDALKPHVIGTQTLYHSRHPNVAELGDDPSYERAYRRTMADEAKGVGMLDAAFGENRCVFQCPPGNSVSAVACDVYSDLGIPFSAGYGFTGEGGGNLYSLMVGRPGYETLGLWYFNQYHLPYYLPFHLEAMMPTGGRPCPDFKAALDKIAQYDFAGLYMHPHMAVKTAHWDGPNYRKGNLVKWREWKQVKDRDPADTAVYYERLRAFIRAAKADDRIEITDIEALKATLKPRVAITRADIPTVRQALLKDFGCLHEPASWCVADVFQAAVRFLRGEGEAAPAKAYGFLSRPAGVKEPTTVSAADLRAAAAKLDLGTFIPTEIAVGKATLGPADFLFAALEVLETGAATATVVPREQLGSFKLVPGLENMKISGKWLHPDSFKDEYLSERMRLQLWTLRIE